MEVDRLPLTSSTGGADTRIIEAPPQPTQATPASPPVPVPGFWNSEERVMSTHPGTLLQVVAEECDGPTVLGLSGELDMGTAPDLLAVAHDVLGRGGSDIVLDLSELAFIDSTGLSTLLMLSRKVTGLGGTLALRSPSTRVEEVLRVTGLSGYFGLG